MEFMKLVRVNRRILILIHVILNSNEKDHQRILVCTISKELPWRKRGHPITWQGKLGPKQIFFILLISVLLYQLLAWGSQNDWNRVICVLLIF